MLSLIVTEGIEGTVLTTAIITPTRHPRGITTDGIRAKDICTGTATGTTANTVIETGITAGGVIATTTGIAITTRSGFISGEAITGPDRGTEGSWRLNHRGALRSAPPHPILIADTSHQTRSCPRNFPALRESCFPPQSAIHASRPTPCLTKGLFCSPTLPMKMGQVHRLVCNCSTRPCLMH